MQRRVRTQKPPLLRKSILVCAIFTGIAGLIFISFGNDKEIVRSDIPVPRQYSDSTITKNAKVADTAFAHIGFAPTPVRKENSQLASIIESVSLLFNSTERHAQSEKEHGTWIWTPILQMTPAYIDHIIINAKKEGINVLYVSIDSYLDIFALSKYPERKQEMLQKEKQFTDTLSYLIRQARRNGIDVDAEAGWRNWAQTGHTYKAYAIVDYVQKFNKTQPYKFRGFQYDVEPYLLDEYKIDKEAVLKEFISLVEDTRYALDESQLAFSVVIPEFFDGADGLTPKFVYNSRYGYTIDHLLSVLREKENTSIIIMAYRNFALGKDGSIDISKKEVRLADRRRYSTNIIIAQETGDVLPPYITFHNSTKEHLRSEVAKINEAFGDNKSFGGIAVHYVNAFLALK